MVIEKCTGNAYGAEVQRRILHPAGMASTVAGFDETTIPEPHARGYLPDCDELVDITEYSPAWAWSAGGIVSTAEDLNRFYAALLTGRLLPAKQLMVMQETEPAASDPQMGLGLGIARVSLPGGGFLWGNAGGFYGYLAWSFHTPDARRCSLPPLSIWTEYLSGCARPAAGFPWTHEHPSQDLSRHRRGHRRRLRRRESLARRPASDRSGRPGHRG
jgi:CubicO group peptidase (beta-lactamase class C family)